MSLPTPDCFLGLTPEYRLKAIYEALYNIHQAADTLFITPQEFGAVGDGTTDDTAAFLAAADYINTNSGILFLPLGTYRITSTVTFIGTLSPDTGYYGRFAIIGQPGSVIQSEVAGVGIQIGDAAATRFVSNAVFETFTLRGPDSGSPWDGVSIGMDFVYQGGGFYTFNNVIVSDFGHAGLRFNDKTNVVFNNCHGVTCKRWIAAGYKSDLWVFNGGGVGSCDIGVDFGYWDPDAVPPGITTPYGPNGVVVNALGIALNRIGFILGGFNPTAVVMNGCYSENNTLAIMLGHDPSENWFPGDAARTATQVEDAGVGGCKLAINGYFTLGDDHVLRSWREAQVDILHMAGTPDAGGCFEARNAAADETALFIRDSISPVTWSNGSTDTLVAPRYQFPPDFVVSAGGPANSNTTLAANAFTKITLDVEIQDTNGNFASSTFTAKQDGTVTVSACINATIPFAGQQLRMDIFKNGSSYLLLEYIVSKADSQTAFCQGQREVVVSKGDTIDIRGFQDSGGNLNTFGPATYFSVTPSRNA